MKYHTESKQLIINAVSGDYRFAIIKGNRGLHVSSGALSILINHLEVNQASQNHYVVMMNKEDEFIGCIDIYKYEELSQLNELFSIQSFDSVTSDGGSNGI